MGHMLIVINGEINDYKHYVDLTKTVDTVVVVDGGSRHIKPLGIKADVLLGDFDSIEDFESFRVNHAGVEVVQFPPRKNFTDTELAVEYAISCSPDKVTLIGCIGTRMDHTFSTILLLKKFLEAGIHAEMVNEHNVIRLIDRPYDIKGNIGDLMSLVPVTELAEGINLYGFEYPLEDATLALGSSTGISNVFASEKARIELRSGLLLVFQSKD